MPALFTLLPQTVRSLATAIPPLWAGLLRTYALSIIAHLGCFARHFYHK